MNKAVFLDRDGVINEDVDNLHNLGDIKIIPGVPDALSVLHNEDYKLIVISNQPVIARGLATERDVVRINEEIKSRIKNMANVEINGFYFCPHHPNANVEAYRMICSCRKPLPGMILQAARDFNIDITRSYMIGDRTSDIIAGKRAGCRTILIEREYSRKKIVGEYDTEETPDFIAKDLSDAVKRIII